MASDAGGLGARTGDDKVHTPESIPAELLRSTLCEVLVGKDLEAISLGEVRAQLAVKLGFRADALDARKKEVSTRPADRPRQDVPVRDAGQSASAHRHNEACTDLPHQAP